MRKLNLSHTRLNIDAIATELKNSCPNLERLNLECCTLTPQSIDALADCKNLREVDFSFCELIGRIKNGGIFVKLFSSCQYLETINLKCFKSLTKRDNETLTLCKNLKSLNLSCVNSVTPDICSQLFEKCPKLNKLDLSSCKNITKEMIDKWNKKIYNVIVFTNDF
ncbi:PREDICTED: F-box/LRR-repeat protein 15-like [Wasmannia auropunctata]|uniref:F-box/LRR-repeat protein 15-like n=1 Tax=Wasmannia auropunctata TaxID=64793 RepID=UPI0005EF068C|nr:PREDICTED: F-box/LRR-repeat protein 15-like [Wasmannia auropunctata]